MPKFVPQNLQLIVCSGGGVATTMLCDFLSEYYKLNEKSDKDSLKHLPMPPISFRSNFKCIFLYGDPVNTTISLFRRNYHHLQSRKLQRHKIHKKIIPPKMTLEEYADSGVDSLGLHEQFVNYLESHLIYPTLFIRYEFLWENLLHIQNFLGKTKMDFDKFPKKNSRISLSVPVDPHIRDKLKDINKDFIELINSLPHAFVKENKSCNYLTRIMFSKSLYLAVENKFKNLVLHDKNKSYIYGERQGISD